MDMGQTKKKGVGRGRPKMSEGAAKRAAFNTRLRGQLKSRLEDAARNAGRSLSEEIEARLERSIQFEGYVDEAMANAYGPRNAGMLLLMGRILRGVDTVAAMYGKGQWTEDPATFEIAVHHATALLLSAHPGPSAAVAGKGAHWLGEKLSTWSLIAMVPEPDDDPAAALLGATLLPRLADAPALKTAFPLGEKAE